MQGFPFEQFHDEELMATLLTDVVDGAHVRVIECGNRARLPLESRGGQVACSDAFGEHLDGDVAMQSRVTPSIDFAHAARANRRDHFVGAESCAGLRGMEVEFCGLPREPNRAAGPQKPALHGAYNKP